MSVTASPNLIHIGKRLLRKIIGQLRAYALIAKPLSTNADVGRILNNFTLMNQGLLKKVKCLFKLNYSFRKR